ncbi:hypothetical protein BH09PAT3_BH09PAT3_5430 [soil metagenome]
MVNNAESPQVTGQRDAIEQHLTATILRSTVFPSNPDSFYSVEPADPGLRELYAQAQGDPVLYAILVATEHTRTDLASAHHFDEDTSSNELRTKEGQVSDIKERLAELKLLEMQYRDPAEYPFNPVEGNP